MVVKVSSDGGASWQDHKVIWGEGVAGCVGKCVPAASYSSMAVLGNSTSSPIALMFMRNNKTMVVFEGSPSYTTFTP